MFVKPGQRQDDRERPLAVRAPTGRFISVLGEEVPDTQFWHRRMRDGDVVAAEPIPIDPAVMRVTADGTAIGDGAPSDTPHDEPKPAP
jgi:hypothetical protein